MGSQRVGHDWETELNWTEQIYFYSHCHLHSQAVDPLLAQTKLIHLAYPQMGHGSIPFQFRGLLWWGSNAQTDLKAETGDYEWAGRNKVLAKFLSKSLLLFETCQKKIPVYTHLPHNSSFAFNAATLSANLNTVVILPDVTDWVHWAGWICHTSSKFCNPFCVTEMCCQWWLFF